MTDRPEDIQRRLSGLDEIGQVVGALRAVASGQSNAAQGAVAAIRSYADTVTGALARVMTAVPAPPSGPGLVLVIGAAQGFSGAYPDRIAAAVLATWRPGAGLLVLGGRTLSMLDGPARQAIRWSDELPSHIGQIPALASRVTDAMLPLTAQFPGPVTLVSGRDQPGQPATATPLWPPSVTPDTRPPPLTTLPPADLAAALLAEALFASITLALTEGYRAENQARFEAMARAQSNLRSKRVEVQALYQQARQDQMTNEMIELATGRFI